MQCITNSYHTHRLDLNPGKNTKKTPKQNDFFGRRLASNVTPAGRLVYLPEPGTIANPAYHGLTASISLRLSLRPSYLLDLHYSTVSRSSLVFNQMS